MNRITKNEKRTIVLSIIILLLIAPNVFPADDAAGKTARTRVMVRSSPERPVAGSMWTLTLLIAHDDPLEVEVLAPHFTGSLFLDQVIKAPRLLNPATGQMFSGSVPSEQVPLEQTTAFEHWTVMEYRFLLNSPGTVSFDTFAVLTPRGRTEIAPFEINVSMPPGTTEIRRYRLVWEGMPSSLAIGENAVFKLRVDSPDVLKEVGIHEAGLFLPAVPPGHILEPLPLAFEEKSAGIALKLRLIPLAAIPFVLERRQVSHNNSVFEIPALRIPVTQREGAANAEKIAKSSASQRLYETEFKNKFPALETAAAVQPRLYQKHQSDCENIYHGAKDLWENGRYADALAKLRQNERDHPAKAFFAVLRRGAEQAIGLTATNDEKKTLLPFWGKQSRTAVLRETSVRRIPDMAGEEIALFREGQPVLLPTQSVKHHTWVQVITNDRDESSGWVPEECIIFY